MAGRLSQQAESQTEAQAELLHRTDGAHCQIQEQSQAHHKEKRKLGCYELISRKYAFRKTYSLADDD